MSAEDLVCKECNAKIFIAIGRSGKEYRANKFDKSPHNTVKPNGTKVCVSNWDEFKAIRQGKAVDKKAEEHTKNEKIDVSDTVTKGLKPGSDTDLDAQVLKRLEDDSYATTGMTIAKYKGCLRRCIKEGITEGMIQGMIFKVNENVE